MYNNHFPGSQPQYGPSSAANYGGGYPGQQPSSTVPGGMGPPPGMAPPGMGLPPGMGSQAPGSMEHNQQATQHNRSFPANFQPPPNMPNINFSAPVIRLGTTGSGRVESPITAQSGGSRKDSNADSANRRGMGLGFDGRNQEQQRNQLRENMMNLQPPTREEIARTIFVGNITDGCGGDEGMQRILAVGGGLRRWTRVVDADGKPCTFGFAEYEDADSLGLASEIFKDVEVPTKPPKANDETRNGETQDQEKPKKTKLLVVVDENSQKYIEEWRSKGSLKDPADAEFRIENAKEDLQAILAALSRPVVVNSTDVTMTDRDGGVNQDGDAKIDALTGEVVNIPLAVEDELADIPAEMRETVSKEIQAFRDRSNRRDMERLKREEELEQRHNRANRLGSPPPSAPAGPAGGANGVALGQRVQGAPLGPKGFQGVQIPRDYQKGVSFVNGTGPHGSSLSLHPEEEDSDASDAELESRRQERKVAELEKMYLDQERRWLNREKSRTAAIEREKKRDQDESSSVNKQKEVVANRLKEWDDDAEASRKVEEYYHDRSQWLRSRAAFRAREAEADDIDRATEGRERAREEERRNRELGMADQFLAQQAEEIETRAAAQQQTREPQRFKMSLGAAAQRAQAAAAPKRTMAEVEGLLEDEEDAAASSTKRTLVPISYDALADGPGLSDEERAQAARQLAAEIPNDKDGLWAWDVKWEFVDDAVITEQLRPFVEKKIVEYLGVQEQMLVDVVEESIRKRGKPGDLVGELEGALDEEAENLVKKLWRMLIFFSESEKKGLSG